MTDQKEATRNTGPQLALALDGSGGARDLSADEATDWSAVDGTTWLHFDRAAADTSAWLDEVAQLPETVAEALFSDETRPRTAATGDGLLIILRGVNLNPGADPEDMVSIRLWVEANRIISVQRRALVSVNEIVAALRAAEGPNNAAEFVTDLCARIVRRLNGVVDEYEDECGELELRALDPGDEDLRRDLATLRRQTIAVRRYLAPQREAMNRLWQEGVSWIDKDSKMELREITDRLIRNIEDLDALRERAGVTQEELTNRLADQMNRRMYVLSIVAAIFLPLGALTGLLGINVGGIPGADSPSGFAIFVLILVVVVGAQLAWFRRNKWF